MKVHIADLYRILLGLSAIFFVIYITTGDHQYRFLQSGKFDRRLKFRATLRETEVVFDESSEEKQRDWVSERTDSRKSRLTKSMNALEHFTTTTTDNWNRLNGTRYHIKPFSFTNTEALLQDVYTSRKKHLLTVCESQGTPQQMHFYPGQIQNSILVERKHSILYCNIPKVSSSFWKRTLTVVKDGHRFTSPFEVTLDQSKLPTFLRVKKSMKANETEIFLKNASSFIFVRDPYARLFSGYVNKMYCPNRYYWRTMGTHVAKATRKRPSEMSVQYGHDIKFSEFVKFILRYAENRYKLDSHFAPMHSKCDPCKMPYNFIGKLETFHRDAKFLMQEWRHRFDDFNISFSNFEKESTLDTADLHIKLMFNAWDLIKSSGYPFFYMGVRIWSDLQIRGYLSKMIPFPFRPSESEYISRESLLIAIRNALGKPVNKVEVKRQREEALIQAYRTVPLKDMEKLRKFLLKDCQLFGYDNRPAKLFDRSIPFKVEHQYLAGL